MILQNLQESETNLQERIDELVEISKEFGNEQEIAELCNELAIADASERRDILHNIFQPFKETKFDEKVADIVYDVLIAMQKGDLNLEPKYNTQGIDEIYTNTSDVNTQAITLVAMAIENMTQAINKQTEILYKTMNSLTQVTMETNKNQEILMQNQNAIANRQVSIADRQVSLAERNEKAYAMVLGADGKTHGATYSEFVENSNTESVYKNQGNKNYDPFNR